MMLLHFQTSAVRQPVTTSHLFVYVAPSATVRKVNIAGSFNDWNKDRDPLTLGPDGKTWTTRLPLPFGVIQYKFVVNDNDWVVDPTVKAVSDGTGHTNSEFLIAPPDYSTPASRTDGVTAMSALLHVSSEPQLNYDRGQLQFSFRSRAGDLASVELVANGKQVPMELTSRDDLYDYYRAQTPWNRKSDFRYEFELHDGDKKGYYTSSGYSETPNAPFFLSAKDYKAFVVPDWPSSAVTYQIFPDRFANGDPKNDPADVMPWDGKPTYSNRFGGDAVGVQQHIDYLRSLGIGVVYFNPVFSSPSNHRYDTTDYLKIDPQFGTNEEFDRLSHALKDAGIKTVMDFAFNHTSPTFFAFQDIEKNGAQSPYNSWYFIKSYPVVVKENPPYVAWYNYPSMPKLNVVNPATESYILGSVDYWRTHASIAGVRLDVANEVNPKLWQDLRVHEKQVDPNFWIVGEEWGNANPWLHGDQWDSTMGYEFRGACLALFADRTIGPSEFLNRLMNLYGEYPPQVSRNLMNLLGSHDTPRFLTLCHDNQELLKLAATVQLTWPGAPSIYYGDELGMTGGVDPDNRKAMDWKLNNASNPVLNYYKTLIHARDRSAALQEGDPKVLSTSDAQGTLVYSRAYQSDSSIIAINLSNESRTVTFTIPTDSAFKSLRQRCTDVISGKSYLPSTTLTLQLSAQSAAVLLPQK